MCILKRFIFERLKGKNAKKVPLKCETADYDVLNVT